jgi:hypothetical protein
MTVMKIIISISLGLLLSAAFLRGICQPNISGATCVIPGTTYQYLISGKWDSSSTMQVCLKGGVIAQLNGPCSGDVAPLSYILVIWNAGVTAGSLHLTSSSGNSSIAVSVIPPLQAGAIAGGSKAQTIGYNETPAVIRCGGDAGGACNPAYTHQWQVSTDNINWSDISQATNQDLLLPPVLRQASFFRRKTVETGSTSFAYSDVASVLVGTPAAGTTIKPTTEANPQ